MGLNDYTVEMLEDAYAYHGVVVDVNADTGRITARYEEDFVEMWDEVGMYI